MIEKVKNLFVENLPLAKIIYVEEDRLEVRTNCSAKITLCDCLIFLKDVNYFIRSYKPSLSEAYRQQQGGIKSSVEYFRDNPVFEHIHPIEVNTIPTYLDICLQLNISYNLKRLKPVIKCNLLCGSIKRQMKTLSSLDDMCMHYLFSGESINPLQDFINENIGRL